MFVCVCTHACAPAKSEQGRINGLLALSIFGWHFRARIGKALHLRKGCSTGRGASEDQVLRELLGPAEQLGKRAGVCLGARGLGSQRALEVATGTSPGG